METRRAQSPCCFYCGFRRLPATQGLVVAVLLTDALHIPCQLPAYLPHVLFKPQFPFEPLQGGERYTEPLHDATVAVLRKQLYEFVSYLTFKAVFHYPCLGMGTHGNLPFRHSVRLCRCFCISETHGSLCLYGTCYHILLRFHFVRHLVAHLGKLAHGLLHFAVGAEYVGIVLGSLDA